MRGSLILAAVLVVLPCVSGSTALAEAPTSFTYTHVIGTGDPTPFDPHPPKVEMDETITACDLGAVIDSKFMANVCSFDGDVNCNGGVYVTSNGPYRSFRREDSLPGQTVGFEKAIIPFGIPALHPITGDTYLTAFFNLVGEDAGHTNRPGGRQEGVYVYDRLQNAMKHIADTTGSSPPLAEDERWTDFSTNVAVSKAGAFFVGDYKRRDGTVGQAIYRYFEGNLSQIVGDPTSTRVPGEETAFSKYRAVAANSSTVLFVGESGSCAQRTTQICLPGVYAYELGTGQLSKVIVSGMPVPGVAGGTFLDFAVEPGKGIFHSSIAANDEGDIVLVAKYKAKRRDRQGVFLLKRSGSVYTPELILGGGVRRPDLLQSKIESFNSVSINERSEIAFVVAHNAKLQVPEQGLVFYRNEVEGLRSVFKQGDTCLADLKHGDEETTDHGGLVSTSQALDSSDVPRIYFRHFYKTMDGETHSMIVLAELHEGSGPSCSSPKNSR